MQNKGPIGQAPFNQPNTNFVPKRRSATANRTHHNTNNNHSDQPERTPAAVPTPQVAALQSNNST